MCLCLTFSQNFTTFLEFVLQDKMTVFLQLICFLECQIEISEKQLLPGRCCVGMCSVTKAGARTWSRMTEKVTSKVTVKVSPFLRHQERREKLSTNKREEQWTNNSKLKNRINFVLDFIATTLPLQKSVNQMQ